MELQLFFYIKGKKFEHNSIESQPKKKSEHAWKREGGKKKGFDLKGRVKRLLHPQNSTRKAKLKA